MTSTVARDVAPVAGSPTSSNHAQRVAELTALGHSKLVVAAEVLLEKKGIPWSAKGALTLRYAMLLVFRRLEHLGPDSTLSAEDRRQLEDLSLTMASIEALGIDLDLGSV